MTRRQPKLARVAVFGTFSALTVVLGSPGSALAQSNVSVEAAELFEQGREALAAKDYAKACPKLRASLALDRATGTLISLARCEEESNQLAAARVHWKEAAAFADATHDQLDRAPYARSKLAEIDKRVPRLTLRLAAGAPNDAAVELDGTTVPGAALDSPLPVDPGTHTISVNAAGRAAATFQVVLAEADTKTLDVDAGAAEAAAPVRRPEPAATAQTADVVHPAGGASQRTIAYVVGGAGIAGLGAGAIFGALASSKYSQAKRDCGTGCPTGSHARDELDGARSLGTVATVAFVAGGVFAAAGVVLFLTAPSPRPSSSVALHLSPAVGRGVGALTANGTF